jgi:hypothetical protein
VSNENQKSSASQAQRVLSLEGFVDTIVLAEGLKQPEKS